MAVTTAGDRVGERKREQAVDGDGQRRGAGMMLTPVGEAGPGADENDRCRRRLV